MSASLRFLGVAVLAWAGVRAATLGIVPGAEVFSVARAETAPPPIVPTEFPPLPPVAAEAPVLPWPGYPMMAAIPAYYPYPAPAYASAPPRKSSYTPLDPITGPDFYAPIPTLDDWTQMASSSLPARRNSSPPTWEDARNAARQPRLDRLQLTAWAMLRGGPGPGSLATGGTLGGSQGGARLTYAFDPRIAASLRTSSPIGGSSGGEVAAGVRLTPFPSIPLSVTAERRQAFGRAGTGRSAFALFVDGGLYQTPLPWNFSFDAYAQAGIVGVRSRDLFADGSFAIMRPVYGPVSLGAGMWAGAQPGIYRVDAGPRLSMRVRRNMRLDLDWRQRLAGNAEPGSGPALTLAADF